MASISIDTQAVSNSGDISAAEVIGAIRHEAGALPQIDLDYEAAIKTVWLTISPAPKPVFTYDLLNSVTGVQKAIWKLWGGSEKYRRSPVRFLAFRGKGPIFTLGGDLDFYLDCIAKGDRAALAEYARVSMEGACWNASSLRGSVITMATVQGKALGGGIDAPRSCNLMIGEEQATFCYPEVKFNHFPVTAVAVLWRHLGFRNAQSVLASGDEYSSEQFLALGGVDAVTKAGGGEEWLRRYAVETLPMHAARLSLFVAFHRQAGDLAAELEPLGEMWVEHMIRLTPMEISKLQRIVQTQERLLQRIFSAPNVDSFV
jgi:DSF synthase